MTSPWRLTARQAECLDARLLYGSVVSAAVALGIVQKTADQHVERAFRRMRLREGNQTGFALFVMWAKWRLTGDPYLQWKAPHASDV